MAVVDVVGRADAGQCCNILTYPSTLTPHKLISGNCRALPGVLSRNVERVERTSMKDCTDVARSLDGHRHAHAQNRRSPPTPGPRQLHSSCRPPCIPLCGPAPLTRDEPCSRVHALLFGKSSHSSSFSSSSLHCSHVLWSHSQRPRCLRCTSALRARQDADVRRLRAGHRTSPRVLRDNLTLRCTQHTRPPSGEQPEASPRSVSRLSAASTAVADLALFSRHPGASPR